MACLKMRQRTEVMKKKKSNDSGAMSVCKWFLEWGTYNSYSWCLYLKIYIRDIQYTSEISPSTQCPSVSLLPIIYI